jgi:hypothetical protein
MWRRHRTMEGEREREGGRKSGAVRKGNTI